MKIIYKKLIIRAGGIWLLSWFFIVTAYAQGHSVSGRVTEIEGGSPLPGVNILVKGTTTGTVTDVDGNYRLSVPDENGVLTFSFIGYTSEEININGRSVINLPLTADIATLSEVVVIGFGTKEKKDLTGSISTVSAKDIESVPFASPQFALQGKAPGVRVMNVSGNPSEGPSINIRGITSWNGTSQPLYVIDGQIITPPSNMGNQDLIGNVNLWTLINPNDIESISILKDASSAAIYGSRGANGVILITTKRGKKGLPKIEVNYQVGVQNSPKIDVLNTNEWRILANEIYSNSADPNISIEKNLWGRDAETDLDRLVNFTPQLDPLSPFYISGNEW